MRGPSRTRPGPANPLPRTPARWGGWRRSPAPGRPGFRLGLAALVCLVGGLLLPTAPVTGSSVRPEAFSVSLSDTPSSSDPFLVTFFVTVVPGQPTGYNWSFGDGQYWNGSGPGFVAPVHRYGNPGNYTAAIVVHEGAVQETQTLPVTILGSTLRAEITLDSMSGPAPFTATFAASIAGGSGTYPSVLWSFGDGGTGSGLLVRHTYVNPGGYNVTLNVTDSSSHGVLAHSRVNVSAGDVPAPSSGVPSLATIWAVPLSVIGAASVVVSGLVLWRARGRHRDAAVTEDGIPPAAALAGGPGPSAPDLHPPQGPGPVSGVSKVPPDVPDGSAGPPEAPPVPRPSEAPGAKTPADPTPEVLRLSQRIVLHLAQLGTLGAEEVAPKGFTQVGMSVALGARQNTLTNVLRRLTAAGVLVEDVRHVRGQPRRLKVYRLTPRGLALARDLRRSTKPGSSPTGPFDPEP
ncbi:MAG TPA: PKD domain-containing protein [Thermoplasmata archaeon]|nr:PKD domain-containing protein [Thermoplasmata archaeon]